MQILFTLQILIDIIKHSKKSFKTNLRGKIMGLDKVSVVIPVRNEERYIKECLDSLIDQDYPKEFLEIILVDGLSDDKTLEIISDYAKKYSFIKFYLNPHKTVQYAMNIGINNSSGKYIVRMDAHAWYARDYISMCIKYLQKTKAQNVGGTTVVRGKNRMQKVIAAAYHSPFALGGSKHYDEQFEGFADTVAWGAFERKYLVKLGMYDEKLPRSEDDDLNFRIEKSGGKIFITPKIKSIYYPKETLTKLFKQYFDYGTWKVAVIKKHRRPSRIIHLIPMLFVLFIVLFGTLSFCFEPISKIFFGVMLIYFMLDIYFSFRNKYAKKFSDKILLAITHFVIHVAYGFGFWRGIFKFINSNWN